MARRSGGWTRWLAGCSAAAVVLLTMAGCNTLEGMGKDLEAAGKAIRQSAAR